MASSAGVGARRMPGWVELLATRQHGDQKRRARAPADVARQVGQAADVVVLVHGNAGIRKRVDGDEQERQPRAWNTRSIAT